MEQRRHDVAFDLLTEAIEGFRLLGARSSEANALGNLARTALALGRADDAVRAAEDGVCIYREIGSTVAVAKATYSLGIALHGAGRVEEAAARFSDCLQAFRDTGLRLWEHHTLYRRAETHLSLGSAAPRPSPTPSSRSPSAARTTTGSARAARSWRSAVRWPRSARPTGLAGAGSRPRDLRRGRCARRRRCADITRRRAHFPLIATLTGSR